MKKFFDWLDHRTGYRGLVQESLYENIPGGSRWRYVWGSTLVFVFFVQMVTGIFLWLCYSPSTHTAWESVYYLETHLSGGWLVRGMHHYAAQLMMVLLALHLLQVVIDGAYKAPREINFWVGLLLMLIVLGLGLTGYLLPWDQKGYWATKVATEIAGSVGHELPEIAVGGREYGHQTLTRFFALHAGVLPGLLIGLLVVHVALFRRHGITAKISGKRTAYDEDFWPDQLLKDAVACLAVLLVIVLLAWQFRAELGAPADAAENYSAARPEWYFLFLFQFLKYFPGQYGKLFGAVLIPGLLLGILFLMPLIGRSQTGHRLNVAFLTLVLAGAGLLTLLALDEDYYALRVDRDRFAALERAFDEISIDLRKRGNDSEYHDKDRREQIALYSEKGNAEKTDLEAELSVYQRYRTSENFLASVSQANRDALRVRQLAVEWDQSAQAYLPSIPPLGALSLLRADPKTQGPKLFRRYCAFCHDYHGPEAETEIITVRPLAPHTGKHVPNGAPNLYRFAGRKWLRGLLDPAQIAKVHLDRKTWTVSDAPYFGNTNFAEGEDGMVAFVNSDLVDLDQEQRARLESIIVSLSAGADLNWQTATDEAAQRAGIIAAGHEAFSESFDSYACSDCHRWGAINEADEAPNLTDYGSRDWMIRMISQPDHVYGEQNDRMPAFNPPERPTEQQLSAEKIGLIVDWLREEWRAGDRPEH